jgi:hypothetical protein
VGRDSPVLGLQPTGVLVVVDVVGGVLFLVRLMTGHGCDAQSQQPHWQAWGSTSPPTQCKTIRMHRQESCHCVMVCAGVLSLLECLRHLSAPDCHGATLLLQSMGISKQQQQQQRVSPRPVGSELLTALLGLLHERHIAALQVCGVHCTVQQPLCVAHPPALGPSILLLGDQFTPHHSRGTPASSLQHPYSSPTSPQHHPTAPPHHPQQHHQRVPCVVRRCGLPSMVAGVRASGAS